MAREPVGYWEKRNTELLSSLEKGTEITIENLTTVYSNSKRTIQNEIEHIFNRYATDGKLTQKEAKELLNTKETKKYYNNLLKQIESIQDADVKRKLLTKYNAPSYAHRISRLETMQSTIDVELKKLGVNESIITKNRYIDTIDEAYYKTIYNTQKFVGSSFGFAQLDIKITNALLSEKWTADGNYSTRIWQNVNQLGNYLKYNLSGGIKSGLSIQKISKTIDEVFNVGKYNATRLVRTEVNYFANESEMLSYEECGIEKYRYIATLDPVTCDICGGLDNKVFEVAKRKVGKNCPPIHSNDRCTTIAEFEDSDISNLKRRARNSITGKNETIDNISYEGWRKQNGINQNGSSTTRAKSDKIKNTFIEAKTIEEANMYAKEILHIQMADYKGLDVKVANEWNKGLTNTFKEFPELQSRFGFVGESHERRKLLENDLHKVILDRNKSLYSAFTDEQLEKITKNEVKEYLPKLNKNVMATSYFKSDIGDEIERVHAKYNGITLNYDNAKNYSDAVELMKKAEDIKYHPAGTASIKAVFDHEIAHQIDNMLNLSNKNDLLALYANIKKEGITDNLSTYAGSNIKEFIAEGWAEYKNNLKPRDVATQIGKTIEKEYEKWKKR
ncbi:MAG: minor capsid protein [Lachnospiraceae bacterium]|jgi:SPP1 gp7 family putative phage head morphogenesis protein|nr:minor capsid protein [Lachnospiraceae bacterium]